MFAQEASLPENWNTPSGKGVGCISVPVLLVSGPFMQTASFLGVYLWQKAI
jgi:hypothetical protein